MELSIDMTDVLEIVICVGASESLEIEMWDGASEEIEITSESGQIAKDGEKGGAFSFFASRG